MSPSIWCSHSRVSWEYGDRDVHSGHYDTGINQVRLIHVHDTPHSTDSGTTPPSTSVLGTR
jgi:hypothetical protein